jgi:hypothetical protein
MRHAKCHDGSWVTIWGSAVEGAVNGVSSACIWDIDAASETVRERGRVAVVGHQLALNAWMAVRMNAEMDSGLCEAAYGGRPACSWWIWLSLVWQ